MKKFLLIIAVLIFCFQSEVLAIIYKGHDVDYDVFLEYYYAKERVNELLISVLFLLAVLFTKLKINKSIAVFGFTVTFSSMVDKILLGNFDYLYSDIFIICFALYLSLRIYYGKNPSGTKRLTDKNNNT